MYMLKCELLLDAAAGPRMPKAAPSADDSDKTARAACARVSELAPGDPSPHLAVGEALVAGQATHAPRAPSSQVAAGKIDKLQTGAAGHVEAPDRDLQRDRLR